jgi:hypothetical protein
VSKSNFKNSAKPVAPEGAAKPSGADYPVEQAELVSQRERLRKAAAAGADALKSPISSLLSTLAAPIAAMPPKPLDPLAALPQSSPSTGAHPKPSQTPFPEVPATQSGEVDRRALLPGMSSLDAEEQAFLNGSKLTERESIDQFGKTILALTSGAFVVSFIFLKDVIKPADTTNKGCLVAAWVFWSAAMLCTLLSFYTSQLALRHAQKLLSRGLRGPDLVEASRIDKVTRSLNPLAGVWFMVGLILMIVFVATNLTHENSGTISTGATNVITSALSTNGTVFPAGATNTTIP